MSETLPKNDDSIDLLIRSDESIQLNSQKSKRHSSLVRRMRLVLPIIAFGVVVMLMAWEGDNNPVTAIPREEISPQTVSQNELINPKFLSEDKDGQPYSITAEKATQNAENMDLLLLHKPVADLQLKSGDNISLKAANGQYLQEKRGLTLDGEVEIYNESGYTIKTEKMNIDVPSQIITSDTAVTGHGPDADITATGLNANGESKILIFNGPAKLILKKTNEADKAAPQEQVTSPETPITDNKE